MLFMISESVKCLVTKAAGLTGKEGLLLHPNFSKHGQQRCLERLPGLIAARLQGRKENKTGFRRARLNMRFARPWCEHQISSGWKEYMCVPVL